jgi:NADH-quinone oxidoreductase subunit C
MGNEELIVKLQDLFPGASIIQGNDWPEISFESGADFLSTINVLKSDQTLAFDYLFCETCVDWKTHFTMVYHLDSTRFRHNVVLKYKLDREAPEIDSLSFVYRTSEQHEREIFDLFGIIFKGHPNLKRILLTEDWVGYPLRKDYDDPINMIKL